MIDNKITPILLMENKTITDGETEYGRTIEMYSLNPNGNFSVQIELAEGTVGAADVWYECTNLSDTQGAKSGVAVADRFIKPVHSGIYEAFGLESGSAGDGRDLKDFSLETCYQVRLGVKAVGGDVIIKRLIVAVQ